MLRLIRKDILFNWKWALMLVLLSVLMPVLIFIDREETRLVLFVYIIGSILANSHFVSKSCYLDDNAPTRRFLASLPVTREQLVVAKYLLGLLCAAASIGLTTLSALALGLHPSAQGALIASVYLLVYYAVFLGVFFRANYSSAEKANTSLQMLTVMSAFVIDRSGVSLEAPGMAPAALLGGLGAGALIYAMSLLLSIKGINLPFVDSGAGSAL